MLWFTATVMPLPRSARRAWAPPEPREAYRRSGSVEVGTTQASLSPNVSLSPDSTSWKVWESPMTLISTMPFLRASASIRVTLTRETPKSSAISWCVRLCS